MSIRLSGWHCCAYRWPFPHTPRSSKPSGAGRSGWAGPSWPSPPTAAPPGGTRRGLPPAPLSDIAVGRGRHRTGSEPAGLAGIGPSWFALATPPVRRSAITAYASQTYSRLTLQDGARKTEKIGGLECLVRSLSASQLGVTVVRTLSHGIHVGTTLKYVRGTVDVADAETAGGRRADLLDAGEALDGGRRAENHFDLDLGSAGGGGSVSDGRGRAKCEGARVRECRVSAGRSGYPSAAAAAGQGGRGVRRRRLDGRPLRSRSTPTFGRTTRPRVSVGSWRSARSSGS